MVSIIVPIYNVATHVEQCVRSLMAQTYLPIEYVFVNDASPDNSMDIVANIVSEYRGRQNQVQYVEHQENKGLPAARNTGLAVAKGDYIFHCDSDDWIETTMIADMVEAMKNQDADIVYTDFFLTFHQNERYMKQPYYSNPESCIRGMLSGKMKFNVWNKLIKRSLYTDNHILFPAGHSMGEDMTMVKLFCHANHIAYMPSAYYHYMQTNTNAFTKQMSEKQLDDVRWNTADLISYIESYFGKEKLKMELDFFKLNIKLPFLISTNKNLYALWRNWFPEANLAIKKNVDFSLHIKLIQYAAVYKQDWIVKLYNLLIVRFIYGIVYR